MDFFKKWWIAICFITMTIVFAAIIIVPSSITSRNSLTDLAHEIMVNISSYTLDKSENYLRPAEKAAELTRFLADSNIVSSENPESMIKYFYQQMELYPQFTSVYYGNTDGDFFMASRSNAKVKNGFYTKIIKNEGKKRTVQLSWSNPEHRLLGQTIDPDDRYDPRQRPWFIDAVMHNDVVWTAPYLFFTGKKPGITTASPVYDDKGTLLGVVGVDISIEELSTFLKTLVIGEHGRAFIVNSSGDVVAFPDLDELKQISQTSNKIRLSKISELKDTISRQAYESLNLAPDKLPAQPIFTTFVHNDKRYSAMFTPFKNSQWPWMIGMYIPENDYLGNIKKTRGMNIFIAIMVVILAGITGWVIARKLETAKNEAIAANKAKSQFLAVMSHEIRTPMNVILGATELLEKNNPRDDQREFIKLLSTAGAGLLDLINDVLDMSKVEAGLLELDNVSFSPGDVVRQSYEVFKFAAASKGINLSLKISEGFPDRVIGDPYRLKQILINLIGNAVKFTRDGEITVRANALEVGRSGNIKLVFTIRDTGRGIPKNQQKTVFERFTQADKSATRENNGTGLGLTISRSLCQLMDGDITLISSPGQGSTFTVNVNLEKDESYQQATHPADSVELKSDIPKTILLVEDNESNTLLFSHYLKDTPHRLERAANGEEGVNKYMEIKPDIVFMDIEMPIMDGYEATARIREWEAENSMFKVPIIALSAHAIKGTEEAVKQVGCTGYMTKPVSQQDLIRRIREEG